MYQTSFFCVGPSDSVFESQNLDLNPLYQTCTMIVKAQLTWLKTSIYLRTKNINLRFHKIRECISLGNISICKIPTNDNSSDMLTKPVPKGKSKHYLDMA